MPKFNDMTGQKVGKLTVKEFSHRNKNGAVNWECLCDCGKTTVITAGTLQEARKNNRNISCGCSYTKDLSGQKFTRLTVIKFSHTDEKGTWWECSCGCGNIKLAKSHSLKNGDIKSCGCLRASKKVDITNQKFGRLTALKRTGMKNNQPRWDCLCDCGNFTNVALHQLKSGKTRSCGCLQIELTIERSTIHGHSKRKEMTDTYNIWCGIKGRCGNPNEPAYVNYGGRGIKMCERWENSYEAFLEDMGERPSKKHSIDRIDNEKGYEPGNCRWTTRAEQSRNTRRNVWLEYNGRKMVLKDWAVEFNIAPKTLWYRIQSAGWSVEKALTTPVTTPKKKNK